MILAGVQAAMADGGDLVERWRDLGPVLWIVAGGAAALWFGLLALLTAWLDPRRVAPGPATLDVPGDEPPAVVNLLATDWDLGHEAVPATLVDLAARRHLEIDLQGDETFVRLRTRRGAPDRLMPYEDMVLAHVRSLAAETDDGRVPAAALSVGPEDTHKHWWRRFRSAVVDDARARRLSRARWSAGVKALLVGLAVPVALAVAVAGSTLPDDPHDSDDNPVAAAAWMGVVGFGGLSVVAGRLSGERDTAEGRAAAARWLGLRELLADDPLFGDQPPAAVALWDRILAQGTALGVAHGVVRSLPLGAESDRQAWSPWGGRWRVVRVRYPRYVPPGYGRHPGIALLLGVAHLVVGIPLLPLARGVADAVRDAIASGDLTGGAGPGEVPAGAAIAITVVVAVVGTVAALVSVRGAWLTLAGLADLVTPRTAVEGRVLRFRDRSSDDHVALYVAVDDGSTDRLRAWLLRTRVSVPQGSTAQARVSRWLRHVSDLRVARTAGAGLTDPTASAAPDLAAAGAGAAAAAGQLPGGLGVAFGGADGQPPARTAQVMGALIGVARAAQQATADDPTTAAADTDTGSDGPAAAATTAPPLPSDQAASTALGRAVARDIAAAAHPAALRGGSALYRVAGAAGAAGVVQLAWVPEVAIGVYRSLPPDRQRPVPGLGDEAYRARAGGALMARLGDHVLMATVHLPDLTDEARDEAAARLAAVALAGAAGLVAAPAAVATRPPPPPSSAPGDA